MRLGVAVRVSGRHLTQMNAKWQGRERAACVRAIIVRETGVVPTMTSVAPATPATSAQTSNPAASTAGSLKDVIAAPTAICSIDGIEGRLIYRGYSIEDLAAHTTFDEVVYLLWDGDLPNASQLKAF